METGSLRALIPASVAISVGVALCVGVSEDTAAQPGTSATRTGYPCLMQYSRETNVGRGSDGYVVATLYGGRHCTGAQLGKFTWGSGGSLGGRVFSERERTMVFERLHQAALQGTRVGVTYNAGNMVAETYLHAD